MAEATEVITPDMPALICTVIAAVLLVMLLAYIFLPFGRKRLKRSRSRWTVFAVGVFCSALVFNFGIVYSGTSDIKCAFVRVLDYLLQSAFNSIQMIDSGKDLVELKAGSLSNEWHVFVTIVQHVLYVFTPVAFLGAVGSYLSRFLSLPRASLRARFHPNTYVFSVLGEYSLTLARNIRQKQKRWEASLVFASVDRNADDELQQPSAL